MTVSALMLSSLGVLLSFLPAEVTEWTGIGVPSDHIILIQLMGAMYVAFGMINWTAKGTLIGGIYGRAVTIGNFSHFLIGALALGKAALKNDHPYVLLLTAFYGVFASIFAVIFFSHPPTAKEV